MASDTTELDLAAERRKQQAIAVFNTGLQRTVQELSVGEPALCIFPLTTEACDLDKEAVHATIWPYMLSRNPGHQFLSDLALSVPAMRVDGREVRQGKVHYYGHDFAVEGLGEDGFSAYELNVGYLCVLDGKGEPVGVLDCHPYSRREWPQVGVTIRQALVPAEELFRQMFARDIPATGEEIIRFLRDYPSFFAQDGEFAQQTGLDETLSLSILSPEAKFLVFRAFSQQANPEERSIIYDFFREYHGWGGQLLSAAMDHPSSFMAMIHLAEATPMEAIAAFSENSLAWIFGQPRLDEEEILKAIDDTFNRQFSTEGVEIALPAEILTWAAEVDTFSADMAETILPPEQRNEENVELVLSIAHAIQRRSRAMVCAFADFTEENPSYLRDHPEEACYFRDGVRAQIILLSIMAHQGLKGLEERLELPPYFFQNYREVHGGRLGSGAVMDSILELWQTVYLGEEYFERMPQVIRSFWEGHEEILDAGAQTGDTLIEINRDKSIFTRLKADGSLPDEVRVVDFGPWNGKRRLKPLLDFLEQELGVKPVWQGEKKALGIDISKVPDPIEEMDLRQMSFVEASQDPQLIDQFDIAKSDWSASNDEATVKGQIRNFAAYSRLLRKGGILFLDTPFPEGEGSYDQVLRAYKDLFPEVPEGVFEFGYADVAKSKRFLNYYYEILMKLLKDAGFEVLNLPASENERTAYFSQVIEGKIDLMSNRENAFSSPIWRAQGRPRITVVARKVKEPGESDNLVAKLIS